MTEWNRCVSDAFSRNVGMLEFHATKRIWLYKWFQSFSIQVQKTSVGNPIPRLGRRQPPCTMNPTGTHVCSYLSLWVHQPWIFDMPIIMSWHVMSCTVMWCDAMVCLYVRTYVRMSSIYMWYIYICNAWALPQRCSVEGSHSQSNVAATWHSIGKINKGIREY